MPDFSNLYTGRGLAVNLPQDSGRSTERLSNFIIKAAEIKYNAFKENEQEFLKNSQIDPAFFISSANQKTQVGLLDEFNKKWAQVMKATNNNMSTEQKQQMLTEKNFVISQQQEMQSKQDLWLQHRNMIMQNPNKFDAEEWSVYDNIYRSTGEYPLVAPPIKARSIDMALEDNPVIGNEQPAQTIEETRNGLRGFVDVRYSGTEAQARQRVKDVALMDEAYTKDLTRQFNQLDETTKLKYFDADKNGIISKDEARDFNPIIKWAQDTKWQTALKRDELAWRKTEVTRSAFNWNIGINSGNNRNAQYDNQGYANFDKLEVNSWLDLGRDAPAAKDRQIQDYVDTETGEKKYFGSAAEIKIVGYSPDKDMIIVKVTENSKNRELREGTYIGLPGDKYKKWLENKPFGIHRDSLLKQYGQPTAPTASGVKWKGQQVTKGMGVH